MPKKSSKKVKSTRKPAKVGKKQTAVKKPRAKLDPHKPGRKRAGPARFLPPSKRGPGLACKRMREKSGMNQRELAEKLGYTQPHISNIERGAIAPSEELVAAYKAACSGKRVTKKVGKVTRKKATPKPKAKKAARKPTKAKAKATAPKKAARKPAARKPRAAEATAAPPPAATESAPAAAE